MSKTHEPEREREFLISLIAPVRYACLPQAGAMLYAISHRDEWVVRCMIQEQEIS
jgi:hypothetical protein